MKKERKIRRKNVLGLLEKRKKHYNKIHEDKVKDSHTHYYEELAVLEELDYLIKCLEEK